MTNASAQTEPAGPGEIGSPVSRRSLVARRRRIFVLAMLAVVVAVAIAANYGPMQSYLESRSRLDKAAAKVAALEAQKAELQSSLGKLTEVQHLEALAREELTYAREGEDIYIITGMSDDRVAREPEAEGGMASLSAAEGAEKTRDAPGGGSREAAGLGADSAKDGSEGVRDEPGPLERLLSRFLDLF